MSLVYCIRTRQKGKHLRFEEREELEAIVNKNNVASKKDKMSQREMARRLGVSPATLSRELKRGKVLLLDSELREVISYSAIKAQEDYEEKASAANNRSKLGHWEMDCIESGRGKGRACLLVLVERMTRKTLIFKLRAQTQKEVQSLLCSLNHFILLPIRINILICLPNPFYILLIIFNKL